MSWYPKSSSDKQSGYGKQKLLCDKSKKSISQNSLEIVPENWLLFKFKKYKSRSFISVGISPLKLFEDKSKK